MKAKNSMETMVKELTDRVSHLEGTYDFLFKEIQGIRGEINAVYMSLHALKSELISSDIQNRGHILEKMEELKSSLFSRMESIKAELTISDEKVLTSLESEISSLKREIIELAREIGLLRKKTGEESRRTIVWMAMILLLVALLQGGLILMLL